MASLTTTLGHNLYYSFCGRNSDSLDGFFGASLRLKSDAYSSESRLGSCCSMAHAHYIMEVGQAHPQGLPADRSDLKLKKRGRLLLSCYFPQASALNCKWPPRRTWAVNMSLPDILDCTAIETVLPFGKHHFRRDYKLSRTKSNAFRCYLLSARTLAP